jgi:quercetin dioxygenase-like cupin family protein
MQKGNIRDTAPDSSMLHYFVGSVEIKKLITEATSKEVETYVVTFSNGARTKLHYHETDQVLIATKGKGVVVLQGKVSMEDDNIVRVSMDEAHVMNEGDYVCVPAHVWHWHGATKGEDFAHLQIKKPGKTTWLE